MIRLCGSSADEIQFGLIGLDDPIQFGIRFQIIRF